MRKQLEDILIVQEEKMENQDLLVLAKYVEKIELRGTKMGYAEDKEWDKHKNEKHRPQPLNREQKIRIWGGLSMLSMAFFLVLLVFF